MLSRIVLMLCLMLSAAPASAQDSNDTQQLQAQVQELTEVVRQLKDAMQAQQQRITELERAQVAVMPPASSPSAASPDSRISALQQQAQGSLAGFNPEIGVIADIVAQSSDSSAEGDGNDTITVRETELVFGHAVDPYSRLDVTAAFSELEGASLEQAYMTHWGLPAELKARIGRFKPTVGKAVALHRDSLDTVDEPLVVARYFGAEGWSKTGVDVSGFIPAPWTAVTHEWTVGAQQGGVGEGGTLFGASLRQPTLHAHLKNSWDISDFTNAELGATYLTGSRDADGSFEVHALGLDTTVTHFVTPSNKLKWQNELYLQDRAEAFSEADDGTGTIVRTEFTDQPWGAYSLLDYRLSPRFGIGGRFDYVELVDLDPALLVRSADTAWSAYLTFYQSEFARWRLQVRHTDFAQGGDDNTVFLQGTVAIGVHKHPIQ